MTINVIHRNGRTWYFGGIWPRGLDYAIDEAQVRIFERAITADLAA
jgi:hypothetical protein